MVRRINKLKVPKWCRSFHKADNLYSCCKCKINFDIFYQEGDGKRIHSLCKHCYDAQNPPVVPKEKNE